MNHERSDEPANRSASQQGEDGLDLVSAALAHLRTSLSRNGAAPWPPDLSRQKTCLTEWAENLGLLLAPDDLPSKSVKGGQEHDLWHDPSTDRYWKSTKNGVFGLSFIALESSVLCLRVLCL